MHHESARGPIFSTPPFKTAWGITLITPLAFVGFPREPSRGRERHGALGGLPFGGALLSASPPLPSPLAFGFLESFFG